MPMELPARAGNEQEARRADAGKHCAPKHCAPRHCAPRHIALVELVTTAALAVSTAVAVTAVSIGIARADVIGAVAKGDSTPFAIALFIGLLLSAMGGFTAMMSTDPRQD